MGVTAWLLLLWRSSSTTERRVKQEQPGEGSGRTDRQLIAPRLFTQRRLVLGSFSVHCEHNQTELLQNLGLHKPQGSHMSLPLV